MVAIETIARVDLILGSVAAVGLLYLLYSQTLVVHYRRFFRLITFGLLIYAVTGPIIGRLAPAFIHAIHGTATLCIAFGLYDLVHDELHREEDFESLLLADTHSVDTDFEFGDDTG